MTDVALQQAHSYSNSAGYQYGEQVESVYYRSHSYYPSLYTDELLSVINGNKNFSGLGVSEQTSLIEKNSNEYLQATTNIQPYQTYWEKDNNFAKTAFKTATNGLSYYNLLIPNGSETCYWVASRCVNAYGYSCIFGIDFIENGGVASNDMFHSNIDTEFDSDSGCIFPIVSLNSELISGNVESGFVVE